MVPRAAILVMGTALVAAAPAAAAAPLSAPTGWLDERAVMSHWEYFPTCSFGRATMTVWLLGHLADHAVWVDHLDPGAAPAPRAGHPVRGILLMSPHGPSELFIGPRPEPQPVLGWIAPEHLGPPDPLLARVNPLGYSLDRDALRRGALPLGLLAGFGLLLWLRARSRRPVLAA
jgi:hypothetical protein